MRRMPVLVLAAAVTLAGAGAADAEDLDYPTAPKVDVVDDYHGTEVADPYRWLEDLDSEQTRAWVAAENELTFGWLAKIPARDRIRDRLTELWNYPKYGVPFERGGLYFFFKNDGLQNQDVLYVQEGLDRPPRVLLDPNTLSEDGTVALGDLSVSRDGRWLAWATSESGSDWRTWRVREIATGEDLPDVVRWSKFSGAAWDPDGKGFYYARYAEPEPEAALEEANYGQKLYYHALGADQADDRLVYERPDQPEWGFEPRVSEDGRYLVLTVWQGTDKNNRLYYLDLTRPAGGVVPFLDTFDAAYEYVGSDGPVFYVKTDLEAPNGRLVAIDARQPARALWRTLVPEQPDALDSVDMVGDTFVMGYLHDATSLVRVHALDGAPVRELELPGLGSVSSFRGRRGSSEAFYSFTSFLDPAVVYRYDGATGRSELLRAPEIPFDLDAYVTEQVFYRSQDGTRVPMFLVHRRDLERDGSNPTILYGYGGFNVSLTPYFTTSVLPWLEMGGVFALANLRGGGEYGERWHEAGMLANKQNVFDDFIAAAEYLIAERITSTPKLAIYGGSNGGLLVGAVLNQRPDLFGAAVPAVGVMDMLRFHLWTIGWAWVSDYGSSEDPQMFPILYAYSPYHNIKDGVHYPPTLILTADHDDRVLPAHSFKYAARLQAAQGGDAPILIRIQTKAGHGAGMPTAMLIQEYADRYAFLVRALGMEDGARP